MAIPSGGATLAFSIGLNLTDYFVDVNRTEIAKLNGGQDFLYSWDVFYGAADFAIGMLNVNGVLKPKLDKTIVNKPGFSDKFRVFLSSTKGMLNYSSIKLLEFNNFMKYALAQKTFNEGLTVLANGFTKDLTGNFVACALYANTRYSIATLEYLENIGEFAYHFSPGKIITISETIANDYEKIANSKNTYYFNRAGEYVKGEFNVLRKIETGEIFIEEVNRAGKIIPKTVDEIKHLLATENGKSFFWSGKTNGIGGEVKALEIAKSKGGTTLEGLLKDKNIELPAWDPNDANVMKLWEDVSAEYAKQVSGEVRAVIGSQLRSGNIWQTKELPALMSNTNVTKITTIDPETLIETVIFTR